MKRIRYSVAMSLDGFVADADGGHDWITMDPAIDFGALMAGFDTILMGCRTYEAAAGHRGGGMPGMRVFVASNTLDPPEHPRVTILCQPLDDAIDELRSGPGKDIWLFGGGGLFRSLLERDLVDAVEVAIIPVLLGAGTPLLPSPAVRKRLVLKASRVYEHSGIVSLDYAVARLE